MTVTEALEKLKSYEQTSFALSHAMGLLYYDGVTAAPKGAAAVRSDTTGELSRIDYQLTTAPDTVEMLETLYSSTLRRVTSSSSVRAAISVSSISTVSGAVVS